MKAVVTQGGYSIDDENSFKDVEVEKPSPTAHDLLVRVKAVGLNPIDTKIRKKEILGNPPRILGWDAAGEVIAVGSETKKFQVGDRVYYAGTPTRPGSNAQFQCVDERLVGAMPSTLSFEEAAALPLTSLTAWELLFERMNVPMNKGMTDGKDLLIIGGAGGVGSIMIQLARYFTNLRIITTASNSESKEWCLKQGAHLVLDHSKDLAPQLDEQSIKTVQYIALVAATTPYYELAAKRITPFGTIGAIVDATEAVDLNLLKPKSAHFVWEFMFTRAVNKLPDMYMQGEILNELGLLIDQKIIHTTLGEVAGELSASKIRELHQRLEKGHTKGKLVLKVP